MFCTWFPRASNARAWARYGRTERSFTNVSKASRNFGLRWLTHANATPLWCEKREVVSKFLQKMRMSFVYFGHCAHWYYNTFAIGCCTFNNISTNTKQMQQFIFVTCLKELYEQMSERLITIESEWRLGRSKTGSNFGVYTIKLLNSHCFLHFLHRFQWPILYWIAFYELFNILVTNKI
jgi:hypothetical protein